MTIRSVHWHEGMFLRPHHFQAAQRYLLHLANASEKWDLNYNWGLREIELDHDALANSRFVVRALKARLRDGTLVAIPEDGVLPILDLKDAVKGGAGLDVYLAVPVLNLGKANVAGASPDGSRFLLDAQDLDDENTGVNPQHVQVRLLNLKLLLSTEDHGGYEVLPLARLRRSDRAEATPELDVTYIPPVLACDAWKPLQADILEDIYDRIGTKLDALVELVVTRGITFDSQGLGDQRYISQLRIVSEAKTLLKTQIFAKGVHPFHSYLELSRLVGQLAIFGKTPRPPELPDYDHDDLGTCFYRVKRYIVELLEGLKGSDYEERRFIGAGQRMQVSLEPKWLEPSWQMFVGVKCPLGTDETVKMLTKSGQLDMKIGSSETVDRLYREGRAGLKFAHSPEPPRALPKTANLVYFQIERGSQQEEWNNVKRTLTVAIRLSEILIVGDIQDQLNLTIRTRGKTTTMEFTLYLVPEGK